MANPVQLIKIDHTVDSSTIENVPDPRFPGSFTDYTKSSSYAFNPKDFEKPLSEEGVSIVNSMQIMHLASPHPNVTLYWPDRKNKRVFWVLLSGIEADPQYGYAGAEYLIIGTLPLDFPASPMDFYWKTPSGIYYCMCKICISIGSFHKDNARAGLGIVGFLDQLTHTMRTPHTLRGGINVMQCDTATIYKCAKESTAFNRAFHSKEIHMIKKAFIKNVVGWDIPSIDLVTLGQLLAKRASFMLTPDETQLELEADYKKKYDEFIGASTKEYSEGAGMFDMGDEFDFPEGDPVDE